MGGGRGRARLGSEGVVGLAKARDGKRGGSWELQDSPGIRQEKKFAALEVPEDAYRSQTWYRKSGETERVDPFGDPVVPVERV